MKRPILFALVMVLVVTGGAGYSLANMRVQPPSPKADKSNVVELKSNRAVPSAIAVTQGDYVQFNAKDNKFHNIGQGSGNDDVHQAANLDEHDHNYEAKESGTFGPDQGYRVQFNKIGTYEFHDHFNPTISVTVIVYKPQKN